MRSYKNILVIATMAAMALGACKKDSDFLKETQKDALNTSNALLNKAQFVELMGSMYQGVQRMYNSADGVQDAFILGLGTDVCFDPRDDANSYNNWSLVNTVEPYSANWFNLQYGTFLKVANTVIAGADNPAVSWASDAEKNAIVGEARFFRAFAYRNLANVYGGVPIVDKPTTVPRFDYARATRDEVWKFAKADLEFARTWLPKTTTSPGRVVMAAADHLLAEIDISLKDYDGAIAAATRVIDGTDGNYSLVKARFGARATEANKDYYWDLFVMGNQNTQPGNNEGIWVAQFEPVIPGGTVNFNRPLIERMMWCSYWSQAKFGYKALAVDSTGRGVAFVRGTNYVNYDIWNNDPGDIRNNETNIKRNYYFGPVSPAAPYHPGDLIPRSFLTLREDTMSYVYPNWQKFGTDKHINAQPDNGYIRDFYVMRLPETYLLRAEAHLDKGETQLAAADINVVRERAQAQDVAAGDVTLDYVLDERARELFGEEFRMLTLGRLGLIYQRTKDHGYKASASSIQSFNNLLPIPQTVIDLNSQAPMAQNPGYTK
ncbi:MAG: RagB/SusD family nutrient uptake outer membrane protein [Bacteroidetes bacterium]|nr:RagB/SusD family nutrient uptake outer membrane protein [Bacteroidota bacterium]